MDKKIWLLVMVVVLLFSTIVFGAEEEEERITIYSNFMRYHREAGFYLAREEVRIYYQDYILTGDEAEIHENDEVLYLTGNVVVYQEDDVLKGDYFVFHYDRDHMIMDSPFDLFQKRRTKREDGTIEEDPLHMVGKYLELFGEEDRIYAREDVHLIFRDYQIWSRELEYYEDRDELYLVGDVFIEENGEIIRSQEARMWLEEDIFEAWGDVEADVQIKKTRRDEDNQIQEEEDLQRDEGEDREE